MNRSNLYVSLILLFFLSSCSNFKPMRTANNIDLNKYMGKWYEIARLPNFFQKGCHDSVAEYSLLSSGYISIKNSCYKNVRVSIANGKAWQIGDDSSRLKVRFFWPFSGNYWILYVSNNYKYVVVGEPSRDYLWFMSREKNISKSQFEIMKKIALSNGYNLDNLIIDSNRKY